MRAVGCALPALSGWSKLRFVEERPFFTENCIQKVTTSFFSFHRRISLDAPFGHFSSKFKDFWHSQSPRKGWRCPPYHSFAHCLLYFGEIRRTRLPTVTRAAPIYGVRPLLHPTSKARVRPEMRARSQAVLDRVVVNVIQVLLEVSLIPDRVFPEAPLPHVTFAMAQP